LGASEQRRVDHLVVEPEDVLPVGDSRDRPAGPRQVGVVGGERAADGADCAGWTTVFPP
jgi:hypothetical protein